MYVLVVPVPCCLCYYELKSGILITPALLFLHRIALAIPLSFHINFRVGFSISEEWHWDFDGDCIESVNFFVDPLT
jgi:hypothetical protein